MFVEEGVTPRHTRGQPNDLTRFRHMSNPVVRHDTSATSTSSSTSHIALAVMFWS